MKKTELKEIKGLEIKDLSSRVKKAKQDLAEAFMARSEGAKGSKDIKAIFKKRKDIAQMLTILRQKQQLTELESSGKSPAEGEARQSRQESSKKGEAV